MPVSESQIKSQFAKFLKQARAGTDFTQETLGKAIGKSQPTISDYEREITMPDRDDVIALARVLGRPVEEVLRAAGLGIDDTEGLFGEAITLRPGMRLPLVFRQGEAPQVLQLDNTAIAVIEALIRGQQPENKGS